MFRRKITRRAAVKKVAVMGLSALMAVSMAACGKNDAGNLSAAPGTATETSDGDAKTQELLENIASDGSGPTITARKHNMIFTNNPANIDMNDIVEYDGGGQCTVTVWGYNKEEDCRELPEDVTNSLADALLTRYDENTLLSRSDNGLPNAEGIYTAVCTVTDAGGHKSHTPIVVVVDTTPAQCNDIDQMKQTVSSKEELEGRLQNLHVVDNIDGSVPIANVGHEIVMSNGGSSYQLVVTYTDRAGNRMEQTVELSVTGGFSASAGDVQFVGVNEQGSQSQDNATANAAGNTENNAGNQTAAATTVNVPQGAGFRNDLSDQVLALINEQRAAAGVGTLTMNASAQQAAGVRAAELVSSFSHTRPDGSNCYTALDQSGVNYGAAGENIAAGQSTAASVVNSWMNSQGHRDNILNGNYSQVGIACYYDPSTPYSYYWVELFIG